MADRPRVAVFRPADERIEEAAEAIREAGATPVPDPMLAVEPTGATPRTDGDYVVLTSKTGVELAAEGGWHPDGTTVVAIGGRTAEEMDERGYDADIVPEEYTSAGLVAALAGEVDGARVEVARSDHGSDVLLDGLAEAGAYVHQTVLYEIGLPADAGASVALAADGELDAVLFTSSLTVEHFLEIAEERGVRDAVLETLEPATVGAIGPPTARTAARAGIDADVVPARAEFDALLEATLEALRGG